MNYNDVSANIARLFLNQKRKKKERTNEYRCGKHGIKM